MRLVLSVVGTAIAGPIGGFIGGTIGGLIDNQLFPTEGPRMNDLRVTTSAYGATIPVLFGPENRVSGSIIWKSALHEKKHRHLKGPTTFTYTVDLAILLCAGEVQSLDKIWSNGKVIFDAAAATGAPSSSGGGSIWSRLLKTHQDFESVTFYPGSATQDPDPTIEAAKGVGNCHGYRHRAYCVIKGLKIEVGGSIPNLEFLVNAGSSTLRSVILDICSRSGLPDLSVSTALLRGTVRGYCIGNQSTGTGAIQPLALVYNFDPAEVAGQLRFTPRGLPPIATITKENLGGRTGNAIADSNAKAYELSRRQETKLPKAARLTYYDPDRDYQENTQGDTRSGGYAESIVTQSVPIVLDADTARAVTDRLLWEAQTSREGFSATTDERLLWIEPGRAYALEGPAGPEPVRLTRRTVGANRVIDFEADRDRQVIYQSTPTGVTALIPANDVVISGPVNPPIFIEAPPELANGVPQLWIAVSGGDGTDFDPDWRGCTVYVSTDDTNYSPIGQVYEPATMGVLTAPLAAYGGANPDTADALSVSTAMSGEPLESVSADDAARYASLVYADGEFLSYQDATQTGDYAYDLETALYRGLYRTSAGAHSAGDSFAKMDAAVFQYDLPAAYVGVLLYFRFVGEGESIDGVTTYTYTPAGTQSQVAPPTGVGLAFASRTQADGTSIIKGTVTWTGSAGPFLGGYDVEITTDGGTTWTPIPSVGATAVSTTFEPALAATNYKARVRATSSSPTVTPSAWAVSGTVSSGSLVSAPNAPTSLVVTGGDKSNVVSWTASTTPGVTYEVWAIHGSSGVFGSAAKIGTAPASPFIHSGLGDADTWRYWVVAVNGGGSSAALGPVNGTTNAGSATVYTTTYFGSGAPSTTHTDGDLYYDTSTTPYTGYAQNGGTWHLSDLAPAVAAGVNAGSSTTTAVTPDALAGSNFGRRVVQIDVTDPNGAALSTGDGKAYFRVPSELDGMNLVAVAATVTTASSSGAPTIQFANVTDGVDMLSTRVTIDASETDSMTAATPAVIDAAHDDVATGDLIRVDVDGAGTGTKGLIVTLSFQLP